MRIPPLPAGTILGLNYSGRHDTCIALVSPHGELLFACALERISRVKQDGRLPDTLIEELDWSKIACAALATQQHASAPDRESSTHPVPLSQPRSAAFSHDPFFAEYVNSLPVPKRFVCHELSHAASAFYLSGYDEAFCFSYDGGMPNTPWFGGLYHASSREGIEALDVFSAAHYAKITSLYSAVTALLGFTPNKHEGKVTGLAALGKADARCRVLLERLFRRDFECIERLTDWAFAYSTDVPPFMAVDASRRSELLLLFEGMEKQDIAATVQEMAEDHVLEILKRATDSGHIRSKNICLAGGLFANVKINQRIKEFGFDSIFVVPPMTDDGAALGAALVVASENAAFAPTKIAHMFWGPSFSESECLKALEEAGVTWERTNDAAAVVAEELQKGKIVAVFQGAMEYGPRALGNRSILSRATEQDINERLNRRLRRTEFMPFAPMAREEDAAACFIGLRGAEHTAEFMTITFECTEETRRTSPAIVHVDGTARPQIIRREIHPLIHDVLTNYVDATGIRTIVNTSFNVHEEPIVCSPADAVQGFLEASIDLLYLGFGIVARFDVNREAAIAALQQKLGARGQGQRQMIALTEALYAKLHAAEDSLQAKERMIQELADACQERLDLIGRLSAELQKRGESKDSGDVN